jgi:hypothetical protein
MAPKTVTTIHPCHKNVAPQSSIQRTKRMNLRKPKREVEDLRISTLNTAQQNGITATEGIK